jgi:enoyl-CoA hydratase
MRAEYIGGVKVLRTESVVGAERFSKGAGRHGDFSKL